MTPGLLAAEDVESLARATACGADGAGGLARAFQDEAVSLLHDAPVDLGPRLPSRACRKARATGQSIARNKSGIFERESTGPGSGCLGLLFVLFRIVLCLFLLFLFVLSFFNGF